ncbi:CDP-glucose 4,6-dehydratase [Paenibacillus silvae]|uniref:CDP-glucose 4,6-dehydratase n=1 Tax=Paenibacillus silvae TaxID=1325358 RepID=UPI0025A1C7E6|nr:CDP-glucose 4,6-dehydratase [Paenibacillus silvae]MDM5281342.1 CDP-glucose 4,6-dehydratase [Paenibacillus silvae]
MSRSFWHGKKVFVTGHTGFKGSWLSLWLHHLGATVKGYSLKPDHALSLFEAAKVGTWIDSEIGDIRNQSALSAAMHEFQPDVVFHLAAQPLVSTSYQNPVETYTTNVMGTVYLFEAIRACRSVRAVVNVTTDKVYENQERLEGYTEADRLGGYDPYSSSKACSELITSSYVQSFFNPDSYVKHGVAVATARAGNVIGGGDWAKDRLIPDLMRAILYSQDIVVRNPESVRPWQHVLEPLYGYLLLAEKLYTENVKWNGAWNFGPQFDAAVPVTNLINMFRTQFTGSFPQVSVINSVTHETNLLQLSIEKSTNVLNWKPIWSLEQTVQKILEWYLADPSKSYDLCLKQIKDYENEREGHYA